MSQSHHGQNRLKGKLAVITGAARERGIGQATAELFYEQGANLVLLDIAPFDDTLKRLSKCKTRKDGDINKNVLCVKCDISKEEEIIDALNQMYKKWGNIQQY